MVHIICEPLLNCIPFFMTISRHIQFDTAEVLENQDVDTIHKATMWIKRHPTMGFLDTHVDGW